MLSDSRLRHADKKPLQAAALRYAEEILKYYDQYYGIPYPSRSSISWARPTSKPALWKTPAQSSIASRCFSSTIAILRRRASSGV